jgi:hypothetical protein
VNETKVGEVMIETGRMKKEKGKNGHVEEVGGRMEMGRQRKRGKKKHEGNVVDDD